LQDARVQIVIAIDYASIWSKKRKDLREVAGGKEG